MNSIKNAIVTVTLLVVGYGSYVVLSEPTDGTFDDLSDQTQPLAQVDFSSQPQQMMADGTTLPSGMGSQNQPVPQDRAFDMHTNASSSQPQPFQQPPHQGSVGIDQNQFQMNVDLQAKAAALSDAVASRFDSTASRFDPTASPGASPFGPQPTSEGELSLPNVELEAAASKVASIFGGAQDVVTEKAAQVKQTLQSSLERNGQDSAFNQNTFSNQFEQTKKQANEIARDFGNKAADLTAAARDKLESALPALPKLVDAPNELELPKLSTNLANSTTAEAEPESLQSETVPKSESRQLRPKDVPPDKTTNNLSGAAISSAVPPPFANRMDTPNEIDRAISVDRSQEQMPVLPRVDDWEPYVGPPLSAADLEGGVNSERLATNASPAENSLEVVEPGLVLPAGVSQPATGDTVEPFAEPINPPIAARGNDSPTFTAQPSTSFQGASNGVSGTVAATNNDTSPQPPRGFPNSVQPPQGVTQPVGATGQDQTATSFTSQTQTQAAANLKTPANPTFEKVWTDVRGILKKRDYPRALRTLTPWSSESGLSKEQATRCIRLLDQLAGAIIYSRQSYLEPQYQVKAGETLEEIAAKYGVPQELIAKINGVAPPYALMTGEKLKVVRGPFRATISLSRKELTLYAGPNYAGRFPVEIGSDLPPESAFYEVAEKLEGRTYFDRKLGREVIRTEAINRYGKHWLGLRGEHITTGHSVGIHGRPTKASKDDVGSLSLATEDAEDVYSILSVGSRVEVRP